MAVAASAAAAAAAAAARTHARMHIRPSARPSVSAARHRVARLPTHRAGVAALAAPRPLAGRRRRCRCR